MTVTLAADCMVDIHLLNGTIYTRERHVQRQFVRVGRVNKPVMVSGHALRITSRRGQWCITHEALRCCPRESLEVTGTIVA